MAHMLEKLKDGSYSMAWTGETPWHELGKQVPADLTPEQMMKAANLDWEVEKVPAYANIKVGNKTSKVAVGKSALVRKTDGRLLDVVGMTGTLCKTQTLSSSSTTLSPLAI